MTQEIKSYEGLCYQGSDKTQLYAIDKVNVFRLDKTDLYCSACDVRVYPVLHTTKKMQHFQHAQNATTCRSLDQFGDDTDIRRKDNEMCANGGKITQWHKGWSTTVAKQFQEITFTRISDNARSRADVYVSGTRFEFQHSSITKEIIEQRELYCNGEECLFYPRDENGKPKGYFSITRPTRCVWVFHCQSSRLQLYRVTSSDSPHLRMTLCWNDPFTGAASKEAFIDIGRSQLLQVMPIAFVNGNPVYEVKPVFIEDFLKINVGIEALQPNYMDNFQDRTSIDDLIQVVDRDPSLPPLLQTKRSFVDISDSVSAPPQQPAPQQTSRLDSLLDDASRPDYETFLMKRYRLQNEASLRYFQKYGDKGRVDYFSGLLGKKQALNPRVKK